MTRARDIANLVDANGDVNASALGNVQAFPTNWAASLSGSDMIFSYSGTAKFKITTGGAVVAIDDITAYGSL